MREEWGGKVSKITRRRHPDKAAPQEQHADEQAQDADAAIDHNGTGKQEQLGFERLVFFSDAVYAIAITLLVIDLHLPPGSGELSNAELHSALLDMMPQIFSYILSFLVIGSFWNNHHRKFQYVNAIDHRILLINLLLLMAIAFLPFPTSVLGESGNATATIFYAGTIVVASLFLALLWWYPVRHNMVRPETSRQVKRVELLRPLTAALVFGLSIPIALYDADMAKYFWAVLVPVSISLR
jgi:uncharacterized membrane protein